MLRLLLAAAAFVPNPLLQTASPLHHNRIASLPIVCQQRPEDGTKGAIGGAVLGGLLGGPFGALFGAQIGGAFGANAGARKAEMDRLASLGIDKSMLEAASLVAKDLQEAEQSLEIVLTAEKSQQTLIDRLDASMADVYASAEAALRKGDEDAARRYLQERNELKEKRAEAEAELRAASSRVATMRSQVVALADRATQVEQAMSRAVAAKSQTNSAAASGAVGGFALEPEDPLLKKFRDLE